MNGPIALGATFRSWVTRCQMNLRTPRVIVSVHGIVCSVSKVTESAVDMTSVQAIRAKKTALRAAIKKRLQALTTEEKAIQSQYVTEKLMSYPEYLKSRRISIYLNTDLEISTLPVLEDIFRKGKACFVPRYVVGSKRMDMVRLHSMEDFYSLPFDSWNIRVPTGSDRESAMDTGGVDLAIVPCAGMSIKGDRLGHGKGYYDAFLTQAKAVTIAPIFREQLEEDIPTEEHDVKIDYVLFMPTS